jgi:hypothetical protein
VDDDFIEDTAGEFASGMVSAGSILREHPEIVAATRIPAFGTCRDIVEPAERMLAVKPANRKTSEDAR